MTGMPARKKPSGAGGWGAQLCSHWNARLEMHRLPFFSVEMGGVCKFFVFKVVFLLDTKEAVYWVRFNEPKNWPQ